MTAPIPISLIGVWARHVIHLHPVLAHAPPLPCKRLHVRHALREDYVPPTNQAAATDRDSFTRQLCPPSPPYLTANRLLCLTFQICLQCSHSSASLRASSSVRCQQTFSRTRIRSLGRAVQPYPELQPRHSQSNPRFLTLRLCLSRTRIRFARHSSVHSGSLFCLV